MDARSIDNLKVEIRWPIRISVSLVTDRENLSLEQRHPTKWTASPFWFSTELSPMSPHWLVVP